MQAIAALALGLSAFGLAFCPVGAAFAAAPTAVPAPVATSITTQVADAAPKPRPEHLIETGIATWYGRLHSHRYTVSGERFDPSKLTAAHRSLPIGTIIRVTDESTGRSVVVRINDREPPHGIRCIDLSEGAARALGIHSAGVADVMITTVDPAEAVEVAEAPEPLPARAHRR